MIGETYMSIFSQLREGTSPTTYFNEEYKVYENKNLFYGSLMTIEFSIYSLLR